MDWKFLLNIERRFLMKSQLTALVFFCIFNPFVSYAYDYGNDLEVLKEQFKTPFVPNQQEVDFRAAWLGLIDDGLQQRDPEKLRWSNFLSHLARKRAEDCARYLSEWDHHTDQTGRWADDWAREIGYDRGFATVESLYKGGHNARSALATFLDSPGHRAHMLGDGYTQDDSFYGVGYSSFKDENRNLGVFVFISSRESEIFTEVVETTLKPTVRRFEDKISIRLDQYGGKFITYEVRNLDPGEYSAEWSADFSNWEKFNDFTVEDNAYWWHKMYHVTLEEQFYLRIVKNPTVTSE